MILKNSNNDTCLSDDPVEGWAEITAEEMAQIQASREVVVDPKAAIQAQINALESQQLLPRITREFMLSTAEAQAAAAGVDPMVNYGYRKLKEFDTLIANLRDQL